MSRLQIQFLTCSNYRYSVASTKKADLISNIRRLLRAHHLKQRDLAEVLGVSEQAVSDKFHGRTNFTLKDMRKIADAFDVSLDYLTGRSDYATPLEA